MTTSFDYNSSQLSKHLMNNNLSNLSNLSEPLEKLEYPSQQQMSKYLKKVYIQGYDFNQHIDNVRNNYLKRLRIREESSLSNNTINKNTNKDNSPQRSSSISQSLSNNYNNKSSLASASLIQRKLTQHSILKQQNNNQLPEQIKRNKLLCSLYKKLDHIQNNLIKEHQKQVNQMSKYQINSNNPISLSQQSLFNVINAQEMELYKRLEKQLEQNQYKLAVKRQELRIIKGNLQKEGTAISTNQSGNQKLLLNSSPLFTVQYISQLIYQTETNFDALSLKYQSLSAKLAQWKNQKLKQLSINQEIQQLQAELKLLQCEIQRRINIFF